MEVGQKPTFWIKFKALIFSGLLHGPEIKWHIVFTLAMFFTESAKHLERLYPLIKKIIPIASLRFVLKYFLNKYAWMWIIVHNFIPD
jgi:hypothetical protein